jgi:hypothetical protein
MPNGGCTFDRGNAFVIFNQVLAFDGQAVQLSFPLIVTRHFVEELTNLERAQDHGGHCDVWVVPRLIEQ